MDISPNILRRETVTTLTRIDNQIKEMTVRAAGMGIPVESMQDHNGSFVLTPLLLAKAQCLNTLVLLNQKDKES